MEKKSKLKEPEAEKQEMEIVEQDYRLDPVAAKKDVYKRAEDMFLSDERLLRLDDNNKKNALGKFFDGETTPYLKSVGVTDDGLIRKLRDAFIEKNTGSLDLVKKKEEEAEVPEMVPEVVPGKESEKSKIDPLDLEDFIGPLESSGQFFSKQDVIKSIRTDLDVRRSTEAYQSMKVSDEKIASLTPKLLEDPDFQYIKSRPANFIELQESEKKRVIAEFNKLGLSKDESRRAWDLLMFSSEQAMTDQLREAYRPSELRQATAEAAEVYSKDAIPGSFIDPETGMRKLSPETNEEADLLRLIHAYLIDLENEMINASTVNEYSKTKDALEQERIELEDFYAEVEAKRTTARKSLKDRTLGWMEDMEGWKYAQFEFIKKQQEFDKKILDYNDAIAADNSLAASFQSNITDKQHLERIVEDAYLRKRHWDGRMTELNREVKTRTGQQLGVEQNEKAMRALVKHREHVRGLQRDAGAYFEAAARMAYNNEGPLDIKKDKKFMGEMFVDAMNTGILKPFFKDKEDQFTNSEVLRKMGEVGMREGVSWTNDELVHMQASVLEHMMTIGGTLTADMPVLIMTGRAVGAVTRLIPTINKLKTGYKVIRNRALMKEGAIIGGKVTEEGGKVLETMYKGRPKSVKRMIGFSDPVPTGWEVIRELKPTALSKVKGMVMEGILNEIAFTGIAGMSPGMITGLNTAHLFLPNIKFKGRAANRIKPFIDVVYKSAIGSTIGMEAGAATASIVNGLFGETTIKEELEAAFPSLDEATKRVLAELAVNGLFFGGMGMMTTGSMKSMTAPLGTRYNKFGRTNVLGYFNPKLRTKVFDAAKKADKAGYTDVAKELYQWLDMTSEPITGEGIKRARMEQTREVASVMPDGAVLAGIDANKQAIVLLEKLNNDPNFDGFVTIKSRSAKDLKAGEVVEMEGRYYQVAEVLHNAKGEAIELTIKDAETGVETKALTEDVNADLHYRVGSRAELALRLENHYEKFQIYSEELAKRQEADWSQQKKLPPIGETSARPSPREKVAEAKKKAEERVKELEKETGEAIVLPDRISPEERFGKTEGIIEITGGEYNKRIRKAIADDNKEINRLEQEIQVFEERIKAEVRGRIDTEKRALRRDLESQIKAAEAKISLLKNRADEDYGAFFDKIRPQIVERIKQHGDFSEEQIDNVIEKLFAELDTSAEAGKMTIGEIIDTVVTAEKPEAPETKVPEEKIPEEPEPWEIKNKILDELNKHNAIKTKRDGDKGFVMNKAMGLKDELNRHFPGEKPMYDIVSKDQGRTYQLVELKKDGAYKPARKTPVMPTKEQIEDQRLLHELPEDLQKLIKIIEETMPGELIKSLTVLGLSPNQRVQGMRDLLEGKKSIASKRMIEAFEDFARDGNIIARWDEKTTVPIRIEDVFKEYEEAVSNKLKEMLPWEVERAFKEGLITEEEFKAIEEILKQAENEEKEYEAELARISEREFGTPGGSGKGDVEAEGTGQAEQKSEIKPEVKLEPPEVRKLEAEAPKPSVKKELNKDDIAKDLKAMTDIMKLLKGTEGEMGFGAESGAEENNRQLQNIARGLVQKFFDAGIYDLKDILKQVLPMVDRSLAENFLRHMKQAYGSQYMVAPEKVQEEVEKLLPEARKITEANIPDIIGEARKPPPGEDYSDLVGKSLYIPDLNKKVDISRIEQWDEATFENMKAALVLGKGEEITEFPVAVAVIEGRPESYMPVASLRESLKKGTLKPLEEKKDPVRVKSFEDAAAKFDEIGEYGIANYLRKAAQSPSLSGLSHEEEIANLEALLKEKALEATIRGGVVMFERKPFTPVTAEEFSRMLSKLDSDYRLEGYIREATPADLLEKVWEAENILRTWLSLLGFTGEEIANMPYISGMFDGISVLDHVKRIGEAARLVEVEGDWNERLLAQRIKELEDALLKAEHAVVKLRSFAFVWKIKHMINHGIEIKDARHLRNLAEKSYGIGETRAIRELTELAVVELASHIARNKSIPPNERFANIQRIYSNMPSLTSIVTSGAKEAKQYSTPTPLSFIMGQYTNAAEVSGVFDPHAGNGSLLITATRSNATANEIDVQRIQNLKAQGYRVYMRDATESLKNWLDRPFYDVMHINAPFGLDVSGRWAGGYHLKGTAHMTALALENLADHGKAAIIIGGHTEYDSRGVVKGNDLHFFDYLYKNFYVEDIMNISGKEYGKMGTTFPIRLILINGRKPLMDGRVPLQSERDVVLNTYEEVYERVKKLITPPHEKSILQSEVDADGRDGATTRSKNSPVPKDKDSIGPDAPPTGEGPDLPAERKPEGQGEPDVTIPQPDTGFRDTGPAAPDHGGRPDVGTDRGTKAPGVGGRGKAPGGPKFKPSLGNVPTHEPGSDTGRSKRNVGLIDRENDTGVPYISLSRGPGGDALVPGTMANAIEEALAQLKDEVGDVDAYVMKKLGYNSLEDLYKAFFSKQIDAIGMSIYNIENGGAMIVGDQTGVGKGRVAAGVMVYALKHGYVPVFVTASPNLFTDMYRDLIGIGHEDIEPFIVNQSYNGEKVKIYKPNTDEVVFEADRKLYERHVSKSKAFDLKSPVFVTYSQFNSERATSLLRRQFLLDLAPKAIFIMDESHLASGASKTGQFFQKFILESHGGVFLSATYAKRPDNFPIYAMKTVLQEANLTPDQLTEAIMAEGPALQEVIASQLTSSMQFLRRQLNMDNVERNWYVLGDPDPSSFYHNPELAAKMRRDFDSITSLMRDIISFQNHHVKTVIEALTLELKIENQAVMEREGTKELGIDNYPYFSKVYNVINQLLLALKAPHIVEIAVEQLKAGRKPFISLANTMEAVVTDLGLEIGDLVEPSFRYVLERGLRGVMRYTKKLPNGVREEGQISPEDLTPDGQVKFWDLMKAIGELTTDVTVSPIDMIIKGIEDAGFKVAEITGRQMRLKLSDDLKSGEYVSNRRANKNTLINSFNNEPGWAIIANQAGSTGLSGHSSPQFKDTSQRVGIKAQNHGDVNTEVQLDGRINRTDQVIKPMYINVSTAIPAELRLVMILAKKLKSLYANTSSNQRSSTTIAEAIDFLNKYGDQVVLEYLQENEGLNRMLGFPVDTSQDNPIITDLAHKVTGRVAILPADMQEEFYREIGERYEALIEYLNDIGANDLFVVSQPLEAETISSELVIEGKQGISAFAEDSVLETVEVNILRKPLTRAEINTAIAKELEGRTPREYARNAIEEMEVSINKIKEKKLAENERDYEERLKAIEELAKKRKGTTQEAMSWMEHEKKKAAERREMYIEMANAAAGRVLVPLRKYMEFFYPGRVLDVPFTANDQLGIVRMNRGVFLGFGINKNRSNPYALSAVFLKFATADSRRTFRVPASKDQHISSIMGHSYSIGRFDADIVLRDWDKLKPARGREKRYIVTGNILQAIPTYKGRLIEYTTKDGGTNLGILMPENWVYESPDKISIPPERAYEIIKNLEIGDYVRSMSGKVRIHKTRRDYNDSDQPYLLYVPFSKAQGERYYTDSVLTDLIKGKEFERSGNSFMGKFYEKDLEAMLERLGSPLFRESFIVGVSEVQRGAPSQDFALDLIKEFKKTTAQVLDAEEAERGEKAKPSDRPTLEERFAAKPEALGATGMNLQDRIPVAPVYGETPKKIWEIQDSLSKAVGQKMFWDRSGRRRALASYTPGLGKLVMRHFFMTNLNITAHEFGHRLDDMFKLVDPDTMGFRRSIFERELRELWKFGSESPKGDKDPGLYRLKEGVAEYFRAFSVNPDETIRRYPEFSKWFEERVKAVGGDKVWDGIIQFGYDLRVYYGASGIDTFWSQMKFGKQKRKKLPWEFSSLFRATSPQGDWLVSKTDVMAAKWLNSMAITEKGYRWIMEKRGKDPGERKKYIYDKEGNRVLNPRWVPPEENFMITSHLLLGHMDKFGNMLTKGITTTDLKRQWDPITKEPISFVWKYEALPRLSTKEMELWRQKTLSFMTAEAVIEAIEILTVKRVRDDLRAETGILPPWHILKRFPYELNRFEYYIKGVIDAAMKEGKDPEFYPEERYNFDDVQIIGVNQEGFTDKSKALQTMREFEELKKADPEKAAAMKEYARRYRKVSEHIVHLAAEYGLITPELHEFIMQYHLHYVALRRMYKEVGPTVEFTPIKSFDDLFGGPKGKAGIEPKKVIQERKGSPRPVVDPDLIQMETLYHVILNGDKAVTLRNFAAAFTGIREPYEGDPVQVADIAYVSDREPEHKNFFMFPVAGKYYYLIVNDPHILRELKNILHSPVMHQVFTFAPNLMRDSITLSVPFAIKNKIRDMMYSMMLAPAKIKPGTFKHIIDFGTEYASDIFELGGGSQFGFYLTNQFHYMKFQRDIIFRYAGDSSKYFLDFFTFLETKWDGWKNFMSQSERSTRVTFFKAEYNRLIKEGYEPIEAILTAAFEARDLLDFKVIGEWMKYINQIVIFSNAGIRGIEKIIRTTKDKDRRWNLFLSWLMVGALPSVANSIMISMMDDDAIDEYKQLPPYQRDMFFNIPLGAGKWITIPKPFELGYMSSIVQRIVDSMLLGDEHAFDDESFKMAYNVLFPFDFGGVTGGYAGVVHAVTKRDYFRDKWIIPTNELDVAIYRRNTEGASRIGQLVQNLSRHLPMTDGYEVIDARMFDDFVMAQLPYYGGAFLKMSEALLGGARRKSMRFSWNSLGVVRDSPVYGARDVQWVLEAARKHGLFRYVHNEPDLEKLLNALRVYYDEEVQNDREKELEVGKQVRILATRLRKKWDKPGFDFEKMYIEAKKALDK